MVAIEDLLREHKRFEEMHGRTNAYELARDIAEDGRKLHGAILILSTWNSGRFRFFDQKEIIEGILSGLEHLEEVDGIFSQRRFESTDFNDIAKETKEAFGRLSSIKGVEYTGASKVLSVIYPRLFLMWDDYIRREYGKDKTSEGYLSFHNLMQEVFAPAIGAWGREKPIAKAIDEYNFMTITIPARETGR